MSKIAIEKNAEDTKEHTSGVKTEPLWPKQSDELVAAQQKSKDKLLSA